MKTPSGGMDPLVSQSTQAQVAGRWQIPVFFVGVIAVVVAAVSRPPNAAPVPAGTASQLVAARRSLEHSPPDVDRAVSLAESVLALDPQDSQEKAEASFIAGSAWALRAAEHPPKEDDAWQRARSLLEAGESLGVNPVDQPVLAYRLARALAQVGADPRKVIECLRRAAPSSGETRPEALAMLSTAYLRLPTPDINAALAANEQLLKLPIADVAVLAPARLLRAELFLLTGRRAEARAALANVSERGPRDIFLRARRLQARLCQEDGAWSEAQALWEAVVRDQATPAAERPQILFDLGVCNAKLGRSADAIRAWRESAQADGDAAVGSAWRLAEAMVMEGDAGQARLACLRGLRGTTSAADYHNPYVQLEGARRICEDVFELLRRRAEYPGCLELGKAYETIAPTGRATALAAETLEALAHLSVEQARKSASAERQREARTAMSEAAGAWLAAANAVRGKPGEPDRVWRSANCSKGAGDYVAAAQALRRFLALAPSQSKAAEAWYILGLMDQTSGRRQEAVASYQRSVQLDGSSPFSFRARYQLAEDAIARGHTEEAEQILRQNLDLMGADPDPESHEACLLALAGLLYQSGNYRVAAIHLQKALDRYPGSARGTNARHVLADCYRRLAEGQRPSLQGPVTPTEDSRRYARDQYRLWLGMAASNYQKLREDLLTAQRHGSLSDGDVAVLREAELAEIECRYNLGQYESAVRLGEELAERRRHQAESMLALKQVLRCYWVMGLAETDKAKKSDLNNRAKQVVALARTRLAELGDSAFAGRPDATHDRRWWEQWLDWAAQQW